MDYDEPHFPLNEKMQPIQWTEQPTGALVADGSLWPRIDSLLLWKGGLLVKMGGYQCNLFAPATGYLFGNPPA
jgi:hypothetical protein